MTSACFCFQEGKTEKKHINILLKNITLCVEDSGVSRWFYRWANQGLGRWRDLDKITLLRSWVRPVFCEGKPRMSGYPSISRNHQRGSSDRTCSNRRCASEYLFSAQPLTSNVLWASGGLREHMGILAFKLPWLCDLKQVIWPPVISNFQNLKYLLSQPHK